MTLREDEEDAVEVRVRGGSAEAAKRCFFFLEEILGVIDQVMEKQRLCFFLQSHTSHSTERATMNGSVQLFLVSSLSFRRTVVHCRSLRQSL